jgi:hypothetical protein
MSSRASSASALAVASTVLPGTEALPLRAAKHRRAEPAFTKNTVGKMHCPPTKTEKFFWDASCRGFGIRALRSGQRSWIYQYRDEHGRTRRIVLGDVSAVSLDNAREEARLKAADVAHGANPSVERKAKRTAGTRWR